MKKYKVSVTLIIKYQHNYAGRRVRGKKMDDSAKKALTNREKCRRFRERLKADPDKGPEHKAAEAERARQYRRSMSTEKRERQKEQTRLRNKAYRYFSLFH